MTRCITSLLHRSVNEYKYYANNLVILFINVHHISFCQVIIRATVVNLTLQLCCYRPLTVKACWHLTVQPRLFSSTWSNRSLECKQWRRQQARFLASVSTPILVINLKFELNHKLNLIICTPWWERDDCPPGQLPLWTFTRIIKDVCPPRRLPVGRLPVTWKTLARRTFAPPQDVCPSVVCQSRKRRLPPSPTDVFRLDVLCYWNIFSPC